MRHRWPSADEAIALPVEQLALRVLDRLWSTPADRVGDLLRQEAFVAQEVAQAEVSVRRRPGQVTIVDGRAAMAEQRTLARAYSEAWDYATRQGWLAQDPARPGFSFLTRSGEDRVRAYREHDASMPPADRTVGAAGDSSSTAGASPRGGSEHRDATAQEPRPPSAHGATEPGHPSKRERIWQSRLMGGVLSKLGEAIAGLLILGAVTIGVLAYKGIITIPWRDDDPQETVGGIALVADAAKVADYKIDAAASVEGARRVFDSYGPPEIKSGAQHHECVLTWSRIRLTMRFSAAEANACSRGNFCAARLGIGWRLTNGLAVGQAADDIRMAYPSARRFPRASGTAWALTDAWPRCGSIGRPDEAVGQMEALAKKGVIVALVIRGWGAGE
jgi:hypothetical protein